MTINSSSFAKALWPGVYDWYGKAYDEHQPEYPYLFDIERSRRAYEEIVGITSFGLAGIKPEGQGVQYDDESQAFVTRFQPVVYALGFIVTREAVSDDLYDVVAKRRSESLAFSLRQTKEIVTANVYNRAFNSSFTGGDGKELLATDHPHFAGGTWANELTTASDLSEAAIEQACIDIMKHTDDRGLRIGVQPQSLHVPVDLTFEVQRILGGEYRPGTANNDINVLNHMGKFKGGIHVNHYFDDAKAWFIRTNVKGMYLFQNWDMEFSIDNDFDTENAKYKALERYVPGWSDPLTLFGSPGA
jgi:hypothetical protein